MANAPQHVPQRTDLLGALQATTAASRGTGPSLAARGIGVTRIILDGFFLSEARCLLAHGLWREFALPVHATTYDEMLQKKVAPPLGLPRMAVTVLRMNVGQGLLAAQARNVDLRLKTFSL